MIDWDEKFAEDMVNVQRDLEFKFLIPFVTKDEELRNTALEVAKNLQTLVHKYCARSVGTTEKGE